MTSTVIRPLLNQNRIFSHIGTQRPFFSSLSTHVCFSKTSSIFQKSLFLQYPVFISLQVSPYSSFVNSEPSSCDKTTLPPNGEAGLGSVGIEGLPRNPPSSKQEEKEKVEEKSKHGKKNISRHDLRESGSLQGEVGVPPFFPNDPEENKRVRDTIWNEEPPKQRDPDPVIKTTPLTNESLAVRFMERLTNCTEHPKPQFLKAFELNIFTLLNLRVFKRLLLLALLRNISQGADPAFRFLSNVLQSLEIHHVQNCCTDVLADRLIVIIEELRQANAKMVVEIKKIASVLPLNLSIISNTGTRYPAFEGPFSMSDIWGHPFTVEFETSIEVEHEVYIKDSNTSQILYGSKDTTITRFHTMTFKSELNPIVSPPSKSIVTQMRNGNLSVAALKERFSALSHPYKISPWKLVDVDGLQANI